MLAALRYYCVTGGQNRTHMSLAQPRLPASCSPKSKWFPASCCLWGRPGPWRVLAPEADRKGFNASGATLALGGRYEGPQGPFWVCSKQFLRGSSGTESFLPYSEVTCSLTPFVNLPPSPASLFPILSQSFLGSPPQLTTYSSKKNRVCIWGGLKLRQRSRRACLWQENVNYINLNSSF